MDSRRDGERRTIALTLTTPVTAAATTAMCRLLDQVPTSVGPCDVVCDAGAVTQPDLAAVNAVARLRLITLRGGHRLRLVHAGQDLRDLLTLVGLDSTIPSGSGEPPDGDPPPCAGASAVRVGRQPEDREEAGVQETDEPDDPATGDLHDVE